MSRNILFLLISFLFVQCSVGQKVFQSKEKEKGVAAYFKEIDEKSAKKHLEKLASDEFQGRLTGEQGQRDAADYISQFYKKEKINPPKTSMLYGYFQGIAGGTFPRIEKDTENVIAFIKGSEKPGEVVVISAHYDHLGVQGEDIYYGADDDASGTVGVMLIAKAFQKAVKDGNPPKRTIVFLHVTGEELGLLGSKYYTDIQPIFPLKNTIANLNTDMIGRIDENHKDNPDYVYLIGSDMLSSELHEISEEVNDKYVQMELDYTYNSKNDPNQFYYRSDHYNFAKHNVPVIFYFNGVHEDYHKPTDTADKIDYKMLTRRAHLIFATAWELANRSERPVVDKK